LRKLQDLAQVTDAQLPRLEQQQEPGADRVRKEVELG
jgi:hypothetical protein